MEAVVLDHGEIRRLIDYNREQAKFHIDRSDRERVTKHLDRAVQLAKLLGPDPAILHF